MFGGELFFLLLLAVPVLVSVILFVVTTSDVPQPTGSVMPTYWGTYEGANKVARPESGRIKLNTVVPESNSLPPQHSGGAIR